VHLAGTRQSYIIGQSNKVNDQRMTITCASPHLIHEQQVHLGGARHERQDPVLCPRWATTVAQCPRAQQSEHQASLEPAAPSSHSAPSARQLVHVHGLPTSLTWSMSSRCTLEGRDTNARPPWCGYSGPSITAHLPAPARQQSLPNKVQHQCSPKQVLPYIRRNLGGGYSGPSITAHLPAPARQMGTHTQSNLCRPEPGIKGCTQKPWCEYSGPCTMHTCQHLHSNNPRPAKFSTDAARACLHE
jgi:hypothetical protein